MKSARQTIHILVCTINDTDTHDLIDTAIIGVSTNHDALKQIKAGLEARMKPVNKLALWFHLEEWRNGEVYLPDALVDNMTEVPA